MGKTETPAALKQVRTRGLRWAFCASGLGWVGQPSPGPVACGRCQRRRVKWKMLIWWSGRVRGSQRRSGSVLKADGQVHRSVQCGLLWLGVLHALLWAATQPPPYPFLHLESQSSLIMTCWPSLLGLGMLLIFSHKSVSPSEENNLSLHYRLNPCEYKTEPSCWEDKN